MQNGDTGARADEALFGKALAELSQTSTLSEGNLPGLAHLLPEQVDRFAATWNALDQSSKLALLRALSDAESESLRLEFNAIYHLALEDESPAVRREAIESVVEDESRWLLDRLLKMLVEDDDVEVRAAAARGLDPMVQRAELGDLLPGDVERLRKTLVETIHRPGERLDVRAKALESVGYFSGELIRRELEAGLRDDGMRLHAVRAMGHSAGENWLSTVLDLFDDPDDAIREAAATAAGEIGSEDSVERLTVLVDDPDMGVRLAAIAALGEIGGEDARVSLIYAAEDKRAQVRQAARKALENMDFFEDPLAT